MNWAEIKKAVNSNLSKPLNELITDKIKIFTSNGTFVVPRGVSVVHVIMIGGGAGGSSLGSGGGSGVIQEGYIKVNEGESIPITIGIGGAVGKSGGITSFGTYLSAIGGEAPVGFGGGGFGGSGGGSSKSDNNIIAGDGGSGNAGGDCVKFDGTTLVAGGKSARLTDNRYMPGGKGDGPGYSPAAGGGGGFGTSAIFTGAGADGVNRGGVGYGAGGGGRGGTAANGVCIVMY